MNQPLGCPYCGPFRRCQDPDNCWTDKDEEESEPSESELERRADLVGVPLWAQV